jgi:hypothetical protein
VLTGKLFIGNRTLLHHSFRILFASWARTLRSDWQRVLDVAGKSQAEGNVIEPQHSGIDRPRNSDVGAGLLNVNKIFK